MANRKGTKGEDWSINIYKKKNPHTHTQKTQYWVTRTSQFK
jgi:hypothetical protein